MHGPSPPPPPHPTPAPPPPAPTLWCYRHGHPTNEKIQRLRSWPFDFRMLRLGVGIHDSVLIYGLVSYKNPCRRLLQSLENLGLSTLVQVPGSKTGDLRVVESSCGSKDMN